MCGIIGYVGGREAADVLVTGLSNLEYRGYDSAGISVFEGSTLTTVKTKGRLKILKERLSAEGCPKGCVGIGHTRWATHGEPSDVNSHPHSTPKLSLVHNGIIENYLDLRRYLTDHGYRFESQTDTEAAAKLLDCFYDGDPVKAIRLALKMIEGSYAFGILFADHPNTLYAVRKDSPLIVGLGEKGAELSYGSPENYIASDVPAILEYTRSYHLLEEGEIAILRRDGVEILGADNRPIHKERLTAQWDVTQAQKGGYPHFMLKEIHEQPSALRDTLHPRIKEGLPNFSADGIPASLFGSIQRLHIVACGTAMHAGTVGKFLIEQLARLPVEVDLASEFRYRNPILDKDSLVAVISQSGETADTLAALRLARERGAKTLAIVNVAGSSIAREADYVIHTYAGPEIAVASTKAFSVQIGVTYLLAIRLGLDRAVLTKAQAREYTAELLRAVGKTEEVIASSAFLEKLADEFTETASLFYLGRGIDHAMAMEGSLKLKEISYIHSEAYAAGELKHGTISLITQGVPVVGLVTQRELLPKIVSNIKETRSRGAAVLVITKEGFDIDRELYDHILYLPDVNDLFLPLLSVIALQLFAYYVAVARGCSVDKPRNLAKSVTVE
ncbi:MAG: glutamine--fructose-6-phosphate transaminase (isomerizing) [Oscillospiraceae bacterium]